MNIRMDQDPFARNAKSTSKFHHEVLLLRQIRQTKPEVKNANIKYYDVYYTVIKNRNEKQTVDDEYENDYFNLMIS